MSETETDMEINAEWKTVYQQIEKFADKYNKMPAARSNDEHEKKLGLWAAEQRKMFKKKELEENKVEMLESVNKWFWARSTKNKDKLNVKKKHIKESTIEERKKLLENKELDELFDIILKLQDEKVILLS